MSVLSLIQETGGELEKLRARVRALESECARQRDLLDRRPALNNGLALAYLQWTTLVHKSDFYVANGRLPTEEELI